MGDARGFQVNHDSFAVIHGQLSFYPLPRMCK